MRAAGGGDVHVFSGVQHWCTVSPGLFALSFLLHAHIEFKRGSFGMPLTVHCVSGPALCADHLLTTAAAGHWQVVGQCDLCDARARRGCSLPG